MNLGATVRAVSFERWKMGLATLSGLLIFVATLFTASGAYAESREQCQRRIAHADHELHEAIEHHGVNSRQAERKRHDLHEARERCWRENHAWWDEDQHRWHTQQDWDDRDHYREDYK
jgi:hypothetical protein